MIYSHEVRFLGEIPSTDGVLIIDRFGYADCNEAFTQAIYISIENGYSREVLSDLQTPKFATGASGVVKTSIIPEDKVGVSEFSIVHPYEEERGYFWYQRQRRIELENKIVDLSAELELLKAQMRRMCMACDRFERLN